jgi:folylpolyglutamate synthase/dihydropteroate synthase
LGRTLQEWMGDRPGEVQLVWGMQGDKDHAGFLRALTEGLGPRQIAGVHCYAVPGKRGAPAGALAQVAGKIGLAHTSTVDVEAALHQAQGAVGPRDVIVVAGSLYTLEAARAVVGNGP